MPLPKKHRLNLRLHRQRVEISCKNLHSPLFTYLIASQQESLPGSRFAILISKKLAKKAVERNKIKRRVFENLQNSLANLPQHHDIILIPKAAILNKTSHQVSQDIQSVSKILNSKNKNCPLIYIKN